MRTPKTQIQETFLRTQGPERRTMKDLGTKRKDTMYPTMATQDNKIDYPHLSLPRSLFGEKLDVSEVKELKIKIKVEGLVKNEYRDEVDACVMEGEVINQPKSVNA
jgi:hypothetical protein